MKLRWVCAVVSVRVTCVSLHIVASKRFTDLTVPHGKVPSQSMSVCARERVCPDTHTRAHTHTESSSDSGVHFTGSG